MLSYEECYKIAQDYKDNIDNVLEYEKAYVFGAHEDENYIGGAGHTAVVVWKNNGAVTNFPELVINGPGKEIRSFDI